MKSLILTTVVILLFFPVLLAQYPITGNWKNEETGSSVEIFKKDDIFYGKIVKVEGNSDKEKVGQLLLTDITFVTSSKTYKGQINAANGFTATCELEFIDKNKLQLTAKKLFVKKRIEFSRIESP
ncbi:MAG: DUF2147 domain-containing protein [Bacteroidales bacterium]|nr:DUF2147 domain-containing protein [Bacteroidales bacterium]